MPTCSQYKIIHTLESKKQRESWTRAVRLCTANSYERRQIDDSDDSNPERLNSNAARPWYETDRTWCEDARSQSSISSPSSETPLSGPVRTETFSHEPISDPSLKKRLYCLGFRGLPGEQLKERDNIETVLKHRPGICKKLVKNVEEKKEEDEVVIEGITSPAKVIDISCVDPALLKPTALCFDDKGLDISHLQLKKALDKVLKLCDGAAIKTIQYENRRLLGENYQNRWMLYADSQESRNDLCGRQLVFGDKTAVMRRHDDLVLLAHKRALRAQAWKDILSK